MSRNVITSDLHLDHENILKFRTCAQGLVKTVDEYNSLILDNIRYSVNKRDTLMVLGDVAFTVEALMKLNQIKCNNKILYLGNHDIQGAIKMEHLMQVFDKIYSLKSYKNIWMSHAPVHPDEIRKKRGCVHGHTHEHVIQDYRYINVCLDRTNLKPVPTQDVIDRLQEQLSTKSVIMDLFN